MNTIHLISHTHWDREWYLTFQQFRLKLVFMVDDLLELLARDPGFQYFMLDGQTIILEDYLTVRPEREEELRSLVRSGRLLVGPWYILPDEFLVSPEAIVRNLLEGDRVAGRFGDSMKVGYIPDPFGHIGQMPQILAGLGIETACVQRGLSDEHGELWWQSPDGTRVLMAYLRDGYGNAAFLPTSDPEKFIGETRRLRDSLLPHCHTSHILLMQGTDHTLAQEGIAACIERANRESTEDRIIHSNLPFFFSQVRSEIQSQKSISLPTITGELRSGKRHHLLPGVLSSRVWIKQRNHECEILLEKWAEPYDTFGHQLSLTGPKQIPDRSRAIFQSKAAMIRQAWRMLLECQPHDSICGCSIDQVHDEMRSRFDQVEQIGEEITRLSLEDISIRVDTTAPFSAGTQSTIGDSGKSILSIVVFNPNDSAGTELVEVTLPVGDIQMEYDILDDDGGAVTNQFLEANERPLATLSTDRLGLFDLLKGVSDGKVTGFPVQGLSIQQIKLERNSEALHIYVSLSDFGQPNNEAISGIAPEFTAILADPLLEKLILKASIVSRKARFLAERIPPHGYRTFWLRSKAEPLLAETSSKADQPPVSIEPLPAFISNEFFRVEVSAEDGAMTLTDLRNGSVFRNINRFVDGGDCGDEYNFCNPSHDRLVTGKMLRTEYSFSPLMQAIHIECEMQIPAGLESERSTRSAHTLPLKISTTAKLVPSAPRLDIHTVVENQSKDHRLRVHFPLPFDATHANFDGHYEVVKRPLGALTFDESWVEMPRPESPQRAFTSISGAEYGLVVANQGLREAEAMKNEDGTVEIALTLLRCVGWLSRDDFPARKGHAGPALPTPGAQMIGHWIFDYSVVPFRKGEELYAYHQAYAFNSPPRAITEEIHTGFLPGAASFVQVHPQSFAISAIKEAEDGQGWIIRGYNLTSDSVRVKFKFLLPFHRVFRTNLKEEPIEELETESDTSISTLVQGHQILTLRLDLGKDSLE